MIGYLRYRTLTCDLWHLTRQSEDEPRTRSNRAKGLQHRALHCPKPLPDLDTVKIHFFVRDLDSTLSPPIPSPPPKARHEGTSAVVRGLYKNDEGQRTTKHKSPYSQGKWRRPALPREEGIGLGLFEEGLQLLLELLRPVLSASTRWAPGRSSHKGAHKESDPSPRGGVWERTFGF